jgi:hypothetical protein
LFGIFGSPTKEIVQLPGRTVYTGGAIVYQNVTQNVTVEKPVYIEKSAEAVCGNNVCEVGESCSVCPQDCKCPNGYECVQGVCLAKAVCGNGVCEKGENNANCPEDCPAAAPTPTGLGGVTGAIVATITNPVFAGIISLVVIAVILTVLRIKAFKKI